MLQYDFYFLHILQTVIPHLSISFDKEVEHGQVTAFSKPLLQRGDNTFYRGKKWRAKPTEVLKELLDSCVFLSEMQGTFLTLSASQGFDLPTSYARVLCHICNMAAWNYMKFPNLHGHPNLDTKHHHTVDLCLNVSVKVITTLCKTTGTNRWVFSYRQYTRTSCTWVISFIIFQLKRKSREKHQLLSKIQANVHIDLTEGLDQGSV